MLQNTDTQNKKQTNKIKSISILLHVISYILISEFAAAVTMITVVFFVRERILRG